MNHASFGISRRDVLKSASCGFGYLALAGLATEAAVQPAYQSLTAPRPPHFPAQAKRVIFLFMQGGPSHVDTFDYKPKLQQADGRQGKRANQDKKQKGKTQKGKLLRSPWTFARHGDSGLMISELFPQLARHADDLCIINSMHTSSPAHPQATIAVHTGSVNFVRPSVGSWVLYGLGTANQDLPGFITINPPSRLGGAQNYGSAFLPAAYQGTRLGDGGMKSVPNLANRNLSKEEQRRQLDLVQSMNRELLARSPHNTEFEGVIQSYELAFRMQTSLPEVMELSGESAATLAQYGIGKSQPSDRFGRQCLMARRCAEAGVRYIEISDSGWDQHNGLRKNLAENCRQTDKPIAGLLADLKQRDMLKDTLIVWGGEFGRTPAAQNDKMDGRRHNNRGYTMWMAGGGVKGGMNYGETDDFGDTAVKDKVHIHDLHATVLHLLGLDHKKLTYRYAGRDFRLTDVYGRVVKEIVA